MIKFIANRRCDLCEEIHAVVLQGAHYGNICINCLDEILKEYMQNGFTQSDLATQNKEPKEYVNGLRKVKAIKFTGQENIEACLEFCDKMFYKEGRYVISFYSLNLPVHHSDYIIKDGDIFYPCEEDVFKNTFKELEVISLDRRSD